MKYKEILPSESLRYLVQCYWIMEKDQSENFFRETIYPDGSIDLIFSLRNEEHFSFFIGQQTNAINIQQQSNSKTFGIRFFPFGAFPFLSISPSEVTNDIISPYEAFGNDIDELAENIFSQSQKEAINSIEHYLLKKIAQPLTDIKQLHAATQILFTTQGNMNVEDLANKVNMTKRTLQRKFDLCIGLSPKMLARIYRFNAVRDAMINEPDDYLTSIALKHNYYDQSHFISEFKQFSNMLPSDFASEIKGEQIGFNRYKFVAFLQS